MDNLIPKFYKDYGEYTNSSRAFPLDIDGAKPIERRVLLTAYEICKDHFVKSAKLEGSCLSGDTKIKLSSGNVKTIEEIYNESLENFYVFAFDIKNKRPVMTKVDRVKLTKKVKEEVKRAFGTPTQLDTYMICHERTEIAKAAKILGFGNEIPFNDDDWKAVKDVISENRQYNNQAPTFWEFCYNATILAADEVRIPEGGGLELIYNRKDLKQETPQMPVQRGF